MMLHPLQKTSLRLLSAAAGWHVASQQRACRNALVASTALMQQRQERLDVEEFLADLVDGAARRSASSAGVHPARHSA